MGRGAHTDDLCSSLRVYAGLLSRESHASLSAFAASNHITAAHNAPTRPLIGGFGGNVTIIAVQYVSAADGATER